MRLVGSEAGVGISVNFFEGGNVKVCFGRWNVHDEATDGGPWCK